MPAAFAPPSIAPAETLLGARWAGALSVALLAGLALLTGARWLSTAAQPGDRHEAIVQQPVGPNDFLPEHPEVTAPEPAADL